MASTSYGDNVYRSIRNKYDPGTYNNPYKGTATGVYDKGNNVIVQYDNGAAYGIEQTGMGGGKVYGYVPAGGGDGDDDKDKKKGSGSGSGRRSLNLKVYRAGDYSNKGVRRQASTQAKARNREAYGATNISRNEADFRYNQAMQQLALNKARDSRANAEANAAANAQLANVSLNRGMGYGGGYQQTLSNQNLGYNKQLMDLLDQYLVQGQGIRGERDLVFRNMDEQDRITRANTRALIDELFRQYDNDAYNRYLSNEELRRYEIDSQNNAIAAR